ncbi:MAG: hypothetical protein ACUVR4_10345 [Anaerolineae bacterium]
MKHLLDTCVVSELARKAPAPRLVAWVDSLHEAETYLKAITIGEIKRSFTGTGVPLCNLWTGGSSRG